MLERFGHVKNLQLQFTDQDLKIFNSLSLNSIGYLKRSMII